MGVDVLQICRSDGTCKSAGANPTSDRLRRTSQSSERPRLVLTDHAVSAPSPPNQLAPTPEALQLEVRPQTRWPPLPGRGARPEGSRRALRAQRRSRSLPVESLWTDSNHVALRQCEISELSSAKGVGSTSEGGCSHPRGGVVLRLQAAHLDETPPDKVQVQQLEVQRPRSWPWLTASLVRRRRGRCILGLSSCTESKEEDGVHRESPSRIGVWQPCSWNKPDTSERG